MNNVAEESFTNVRTIKAFCNEDFEIEKFKKGNTALYKAGRKKTCYTGCYSMMTTFMSFGAMVAVIFVASMLYRDGDITIGQISTYLFYMQGLTF